MLRLGGRAGRLQALIARSLAGSCEQPSCTALHAARALSQQASSSESQHFTSAWAHATLVAGGAAAVFLAATAATGPAHAKQADPKVKAAAAAPATPPPTASKPTAGLPTYTAEEVSKHRDASTGIWVTFKGHVYDVTEFVQVHPGGMQKIMLAAGSSIEPFWGIYKQHDKPEVRDILEQYKIGKLAGGASEAAMVKIEDPFKNDPHRHPALLARSAKPFNGETPGELLAADIITPTELFYVRNHLAVPDVDVSKWKLTIEGQGLRTVELTLDELKTRFKKHVIASTVQCGGNRRNEMKAVQPVKGLDWDAGAIGTATFGGVLLRDVLQYAGLQDDEPGVAHTHFVGLDRDPYTGEVYHVSIPINKAMSPSGDVLLAYEMNGQPLTRDHGYPLRAVVPGVVGARNAKWLTKIITSAQESDSFWQQRDYKAFSPGVNWDNVDWSAAPPIQEMPVTSATCEPPAGTEVSKSDGEVSAKGYAWSGGGRDIIRVEASLDEGKTWHVAKLNKLPQQPGRAWAWTLWEVNVPLPTTAQPGSTVRLLCRAVDDSYNVQPDTVPGVWNLRGMVNNAWHATSLKVVE